MRKLSHLTVNVVAAVCALAVILPGLGIVLPRDAAADGASEADIVVAATDDGAPSDGPVPGESPPDVGTGDERQKPRRTLALDRGRLHNTGYVARENKLSPRNVRTLSLKWTVTTGGDVSATPALDAEALYFPDFGGNLFKVDRASGEVVWRRRIEEYNGIPGSFSRTSPALDGRRLILGDQNGAHVMAVDKHTGRLLWITQVDPHPYAIITAAPAVFSGRVFVGVSSSEELYASNPDYLCCTFRGTVVALDVRTGAILWQTFMAPDNNGQPGGYSGAAVWGSTPAIDEIRGLVLVATGNNYTVPDEVAACDAASRDRKSCADPTDYFDAVVALDLASGRVVWATRLWAADTWTTACNLDPPGQWCQDPDAEDYDFGSAPNLFTANIAGQPRDLVGAGQKSGIYWALDRETGAVVWRTRVGPGSALGGIMWGSATDGRRIYVALSNRDGYAYSLVPSGKEAHRGSWSALDPATGRILWQTADPQGGFDTGALTVANGIVFAGSIDDEGHMYALDGATGQVLWSFASGGAVNSAPAVRDGVLYWGSGYSRYGKGNNRLYAFALEPEAQQEQRGHLNDVPGQDSDEAVGDIWGS